MLNVYKCLSENISAAITQNGEAVMKQPLIRSMRTVKKETLKLISGWVSRATDPEMVSFLLLRLQFVYNWFNLCNCCLGMIRAE